MKRWTVEEDCKLLSLVRQNFPTLVKHERLNATMPFCQQLHAAFDSPYRDASALLYRLEQAKILGFAARPGGEPAKQPFRCLINNDLVLYDYSLTLPTLNKALHPDTVAAVLTHFNAGNPHEPLSIIISEIAAVLQLVTMQVEKVLIENGKITVNSYREYERTGEKILIIIYKILSPVEFLTQSSLKILMFAAPGLQNFTRYMSVMVQR